MIALGDVVAMFERTREPKVLWVIPGATHYHVYRPSRLDQILEKSLAWFSEHMPAT
ncbi:MAG: hypothetical protein HOI95_19705 [Chromatiales bacterium]|jgi:fermentation-respiration switch protein FrsA (DUF1100 family)|nr:hypothetical protein [Chromatiales bacterium]